MSESALKNLLNEALRYRKMSLSAAKLENRKSHGTKAIFYFRKAAAYAAKHGMGDYVPVISRYITQMFTFLATSYKDNGEYAKAVEYFNKAISENATTPVDKEHIITDGYIRAELALMASGLGLHDKAIKNADTALSWGKKLGLDNYLELLLKLVKVYITALHVRKTDKCFGKIAKVSEKVGDTLLKADAYYEYARYLYEIRRKYALSLKYLRKARGIYAKNGDENGIRKVDIYIESMFEPDGTPRVKSEGKGGKKD